MHFIDAPVGIDLGTTNSEVALLDPSEQAIIAYQDRFGRRTIPSAVAWDPKSDSIVVGRAARRRRGKKHPPVESVKRRMGTTEKLLLGQKEVLPEEVSAHILREASSRMSAFLSTDDREARVGRAVITVPAYFDGPQVEATHRAGKLAELEVLALLQEPTAAAMYHSWRSGIESGNFLIFDLGGGTFDVSILQYFGGEYQVVAIGGDNYLGGDDFDRALSNLLRDHAVERGYTLDLDLKNDADRVRYGHLVKLATNVKEALTSRDVVMLSEEDVFEDQDGEPVSFELEVSLEDLRNATSPLVDRALQRCEEALSEAKENASIGIGDIDQVVLVGGSTRSPVVTEAVHEALVKKSKADVALQEEVDACVAYGAAVYAARLGNLRLGLAAGKGDDSADRVVVDVLSKLVSPSEEVSIELAVHAPENASSIALMLDTTELAAAELEDDKALLRTVIKEAGEHSFDIEVRGGAQNTRLPIQIFRGERRVHSTELSQAAVLSKAIGVEVQRAGRTAVRTLLAKGAGLPASSTATFATADQSGTVVLRILQDRLPIKTLTMEVPKDLPVGAEVALSVKIDETMRFEVTAKVLDHELWTTLDPPKSARENADAMLALGTELRERLSGAQRTYFVDRWESLRTTLLEALEIDPGRAGAIVEEMKGLLSAYVDERAPELTPPARYVERSLALLKERVLQSAEDAPLGMTIDAWNKRIKSLREEADEAWMARDAANWARISARIDGLIKTIERRAMSFEGGVETDDELRQALRITNARGALALLQKRFVEFNYSRLEPVRAAQTLEIEALKSELGSLFERLERADEVREKRRAADAADVFYDKALKRLAALPSMGVVEDRGK